MGNIYIYIIHIVYCCLFWHSGGSIQMLSSITHLIWHISNMDRLYIHVFFKETLHRVDSIKLFFIIKKKKIRSMKAAGWKLTSIYFSHFIRVFSWCLHGCSNLATNQGQGREKKFQILDIQIFLESFASKSFIRSCTVSPSFRLC